MTAETGFNLLDEPWIPVLGIDGAEREVSMMELFEEAQDLATIGGEVPTQAFAIIRLLLAFFHRAIEGPEDEDEWGALWNAKTLPMDPIQSYAERVRHRFKLFDQVTPFFQVPDLRTARGEVSGLEKIVADVPNGEPLFTTRSAESLQSIRPAEAARWLVHVHAFDVSGIKSGAVGDPQVKGGKGYPIGAGWSGQIGGVLVEGLNLRQTILLNLIGTSAREYVLIGGPEDLPPWERPTDGSSWEDERRVRGAIDLYTWQTRRVRLVGDETGVTGVVLANGDRIQPHNRHTIEPHTVWRFSEPQSKRLKTTVYMPRLHDPDRAVWRGLAAFLPSVHGRHLGGSDPQRFLVPGVIQWIAELVGDGRLPEDFLVRTRSVGAKYGTQNAVYEEIVDDRIPMVVAMLRADDPVLGATAVGAVEDADLAAKALWKFAANLARAAGGAQTEEAGDRAREQLFSLLEAPYRTWLSTLRPGVDTQGARAQWQSVVRSTTRSVADELLRSTSPAAWVGRTVNNQLINAALAEAWFNSSLYRALPLAFSEVRDEGSDVRVQEIPTEKEVVT